MTFSPETESRRDDPAPTVNATRARQGGVGRPILLVLIVGTVLAALGMFAAWAFRADDMDSRVPTTAEAQQKAATFDVPSPQPPNPQNP